MTLDKQGIQKYQIKTDKIPDGYVLDTYSCSNSNVTIIWNSMVNRIKIKAKGAASCKVYLKLASDSSGANAPKLVNNLIPVTYDDRRDKWIMSNVSAGWWYDYSNLKWANAVTVTSAKRGTYSVGDTIEMEDILGMWVWIPRYEYKYTNLGTNYAGGTRAQPGAIDIKFIQGTSTAEDTGIKCTHAPAVVGPVYINGIVYQKIEN